MKAFDWYFRLMLFMLYKVIFTFESYVLLLISGEKKAEDPRAIAS